MYNEIRRSRYACFFYEEMNFKVNIYCFIQIIWLKVLNVFTRVKSSQIKIQRGAVSTRFDCSAEFFMGMVLFVSFEYMLCELKTTVKK